MLGESGVLLPESPSSPTAGLTNEVHTGVPFLHTHAMRVGTNYFANTKPSSYLYVMCNRGNNVYADIFFENLKSYER